MQRHEFVDEHLFNYASSTFIWIARGEPEGPGTTPWSTIVTQRSTTHTQYPTYAYGKHIGQQTVITYTVPLLELDLKCVCINSELITIVEYYRFYSQLYPLHVQANDRQNIRIIGLAYKHS